LRSIFSSKARADALEKLHAAQTRQLGARQNAGMGAAISKIKTHQQSAYKAHRERFSAKRNALKADQAQEKQQLRQQWQERHQERDRVLKVVRRMETLKKERKAAQELSRSEHRDEFSEAAKPKRRRRGRVRKRKVDE
jgi:hypothetical protein